MKHILTNVSDFFANLAELPKTMTQNTLNAIAERAHCLGDLVVLVRIPDALHDLALSAPEVRARAFAEYSRFLRCYSIGAEAG